MKLGRAKIAKSTIYPELKSIRAVKTIPAEDWINVTEPEARGIREIFNDFEVGDEVVIITAENFCEMFSTVNPYFYLEYSEKGMEAAFKWLKGNKT